MDTIKSRVAALLKDKQGDVLTATSWDPKDGEVLMGTLVHREVLTRKEDGKHYDKVTIKADEGLFDTIIKQGVLAMADPPVTRGDILVIQYNGLKPIGDGKRSMHDSTVTIFHTGEVDPTPF